MAVMSLSTLRSLRSSQQAYYERYRFANVFASLKRGPLSLQGRLARIPGVATVEPRIVQTVNLIVEGIAEPAVGRLVSIPGRNLAGERESQPLLNQLHLREGRFPEPGRLEILAGESFTTANDFGLGATVQAVMNGRLRTLTIVGIALSPEIHHRNQCGSNVARL